MAQINYAAYKEILEALKKKTRDLLANTKNQDLMSKLDAELESATERKNLSIAFVGQYNAGKSTIISAMTGKKKKKKTKNRG